MKRPWATREGRLLIKEETWSACTPKCEQCGHRRQTYQHREQFSMASTARLCAECMYERVLEWRAEQQVQSGQEPPKED